MDRGMIAKYYNLKKTAAVVLTVFAGLMVVGAWAAEKSKDAFPWVEIGKKSGERPKYTAEVDPVNPAPAKKVIKVNASKKTSPLNLDKKVSAKEVKPQVLSVAKQIEGLLMPSDTLIMAKRKLEREKPYVKIIKGQEEQSTLIYRCRFIQANKSLSNSLSSIISPQGSVECSEEQNMVIIHDA